MKKIILMAVIAIAAIVNNSSAQQTEDDARDKLVFGLKAGANYANVYDSQGEEFSANGKFGFAGGVFLAIPIGRFLGVQPEVLFSQRGFSATGRILGSTYNFSRTSNYIDIPLFFAIKPSPTLTLLVGPQFSFLAKQTDVFADGSTSVAQEQEFKNANIRKNTLCLVGGIDINLTHFVLGARAGFDVTNNNGDGTSTTPRYKNVWMQATIGYRFY